MIMDNSLYCKVSLVVSVASVTLVVGYQFTCLNPIIFVIKDVYNTTYFKRYNETLPESTWDTLLSLTFSFLLAGAFIGSLVNNVLLGFFSRKQLLIILNVLTIVGTLIISLGSGLTGSYEAFIIGRFLIGFCFGIGFNLISVIVSETCVYEKQPTFQTLIGSGLAIGDLLGACAAHPKVMGNETLWPLLISLTAIPPIVYLIGAYWFPETVTWTLRNRGIGDARLLLYKIRKAENEKIKNEEIENELTKITDEQARHSKVSQNEEGKFTGYATIKEILFTKQYRSQFIIVMVLYAFDMLCGINTIFFYSDSIFLQANIPSENVTYGTIGGLATMVLGGFVGTWLVSRYGGKRIILIMTVVMALSLALITVSLATVSFAPFMAYFSIAGVVLMLFGFACGPNVAVYAISGAVTLEPTRPTILIYAGATLWFCGWLVGFVAPYLESAIGPYSLTPWIGCNILFFIFCWFYIPDTKDKTLEEIQRNFNPSSQNKNEINPERYEESDRL